MLGAAYALLYAQVNHQQRINEPTAAQVLVTVDSLPHVSDQKISFIGSTPNHTFLFNWYNNDGTIRPTIHPGQVYQVTARIKPPDGIANGVGFDLEKWLFRQGIDGIATIKELTPTDQTNWHPRHWMNQWRYAFSAQINHHFADAKVNALIHALTIGDKSHFDQQDRQVFQNTGTAHLIAISGLHIGMVAVLGWFLGGLVFLIRPSQRFNKQLVQLILGMVLAFTYACLAGWAVSTQRALIMLAVLAAYKLLRKNSYGWDVWSASLMIVLIIDPLNVLDTGFWLSFSAVAILILALNGINHQQGKIWSFLKTQGVILIGMLPLSLLVFSRINLMTPVVNFIMIPFMSFLLVPLLLLSLLIVAVTGAFPAALVLIINSLCVVFIDLLNWFNQIDWFSMYFTLNHWWQVVLVGFGAWLLILPAAIPGRYWGFVFMALGLTSTIQRPEPNHFNAYFLDVGQGLSVIIQTSEHTLVYDVGAAYDSGFNMADAAVLPLLNQLQTATIDKLILSHQDNDHSGAANALLSQIQSNEIWGTEEHHKPCVTGTNWLWDGIYFEVLSPYNLTPYLRNNSSCVLRIQSPTVSLLLTGDIESPIEYRLVNNHANRIQADVLLMPHHGSNTSSTEAFIDAVNPQWAINSSGKHNPFNHPTTKVTTRYLSRDITILDTQHAGLITMSTNPQINFTSFRQQNPRIWRTKKPE